MTENHAWMAGCPVELTDVEDCVQLTHGEGARASRQLISRLILPLFGIEGDYRDAADIVSACARLAVATDSHTITPLFFPGGNIGSLAVFGTVNDLAVAGAVPQWMTVALVIEEGFPIPLLSAILDQLATAAHACHVRVVAGDTKVVPHGAIDGLMINTTGIGRMRDVIPPGPGSVQPGDAILVSGPIAHHGTAVMCAREELGFATTPSSDCRSVVPGVEALLDRVGTDVRCIRDATRGGVSAVLHEWSTVNGLTCQLREADIPVSQDVRAVCELLGLDPLHVANEGTFVAIIAEGAVSSALAALRTVDTCIGAAIIGAVAEPGISPVTVQRLFGSSQPLDEPSGAPLPRIC